jgi:hypothetical protein
MNNFKIFLLALVSLSPMLAQAELKALDDTRLSNLTGQAGLTIELATQIDLGSLKYTDQGSMSINNLHIGGQNGTLLDDLKLDFDLAANGDALIRLGSISGSPIDFNVSMDSIALNGTGGTTNMFSNINLNGYLGVTNIAIRNGGNNVNTTLPSGIKVSDSRLDLNTQFSVTDGHVGWDVGDVILLFNFAGVEINHMTINNTRGLDTAGSNGMASVQAKFASGIGVSGHSGLAVYDVVFRADIDMPVFKIGGANIGDVNFTDFVISNTSMVIYGH